MDFQLNLTSQAVAQAHPREPLVAAPGDSVSAVLQRMQAARSGSVMICSEDRKLIGVFTERDAVKLLAANADLQLPVEQVMVRDPVTIRPTDTVEHAISAMARGGYRRLPVVDDAGHPLGVMDVSGLLEYMVEHFPKIVYTLPPQPHQASREREGA